MSQHEAGSGRLHSHAAGDLSLWRPESLEGLRSKLGQPAAIASVKSWTIVLFMIAVMAAVIAFFALSTFARKETVDGLVQPRAGAARIAFHRAGVVDAVHVREGQLVRRGQPLFSVALDPAIDGGGTLGSRVEAATEGQADALASQQQAAAQAGAAQEEELRSRLRGLEGQRAAAGQALALRRERLRLNEETLAAFTDLAGRGFIAATRLREKQAEALADREAIAEVERQIAQAGADIIGIQASLQRSRFDAVQARARLSGAQAELEQRRAQTASERGVVLTAPHDGRVVTMRVNPGSAVVPGATLAVILPQDGQLEAELWAPSKAAGFVRRGDEVRLMFDAFPYQRFGPGSGRVISVSSMPVDPQDLPIANEGREALYRVRVALSRQYVSAYGRRWPLSPGGRLKADLILNRQSLLDWLLDPLLATRSRGGS
jgi:membrane fusion protein